MAPEPPALQRVFHPQAGWRTTFDTAGHPIAAITVTAGYLGTIPAANWLIGRYSAVPVAPGLLAPAGVYMVGLTLIMRDAARELAGRTAVLLAMITGFLLSYWFASPMTATAAAAAFSVSELADFFVYERLRPYGMTTAMIASNLVSLTVDSLLFLWLAFDSLHYLPGQIVGKAWMTAAAVALIAAWHRVRHPEELRAGGTGGTCTSRPLAKAACGHCAHGRRDDCSRCSGPGCACTRQSAQAVTV